MLAEFTAWLGQLVKDVLAALWQFLVDIFIFIIELIADALVALINLIPVPDFLSAGLQSVYSQLDPGVAYLLSATGLPAALGILATGYVFRLGRKVATLFQW
jgi:hypothetical protein